MSLTPDSPAKGSLEAKVTIKDQCDDVFYKAVFAAKKDADPADCKDGQVQIASSTLVFFNGLESGATYHVRACAFTDEFTSVGVVKTVTMP